MFIFLTLAISAVVPSAHISLTAGVMQAFKCLLGHFGLGVLVPVIALGLVVASLSGLLDWLTGPSTGLLDVMKGRAGSGGPGGIPPAGRQEVGPPPRTASSRPCGLRPRGRTIRDGGTDRE